MGGSASTMRMTGMCLSGWGRGVWRREGRGGRGWRQAFGGGDGGRRAVDLGPRQCRAAGPRRRGASAGADGSVWGGGWGGRIGRCRGCQRSTCWRLRWARTGGWEGAGRREGQGRAGRGGRRGCGKAASPIFRLKELVGMIVELSAAWPAGRAGREEGVVRLLGGVTAPKHNERPHILSREDQTTH